ncbi:hypothetical protein [Flavobacterium sp. LC2016-12]|uniref:hypothetical protein n=1 Tax=Flavobacterium sp. LC2016-12 TaxID=2783794 RepID=UPI00188CACCB|nr:hypothetical protein [Flavobacterium sp. LC2016-12]MBF4463783.1 hypothetical protein [Flavobacterium sp. LC2016-12]
MENDIKIEHFPTTFNKRVKYFASLFFLLFLFVIILTLFKSDSVSEFNFTLVLLISLFFGLPLLYKTYQNRYFLVDFESDSQNVKILYLHFNEEKYLETTIDKIEVHLKNTSSRAGFDCELKVSAENLDFTIDKYFEWDFVEIRKLFEFIQFHKNIKPSEQDQFILSRIENYIQKNCD